MSSVPIISHVARRSAHASGRQSTCRAWLGKPSASLPLLFLFAFANCAILNAQSVDLLNAEPFDVIVLNEANGNQVLRVLPLDLPGRKLPQNPRPNDQLRVRLTSNPSEQLDVAWSGIAQVQLFEQMLLGEAVRLMNERQFDEAFEYLTSIHDQYPDTDGLDATIDRLLYTEASSLYQQGNYERALLLLDEVYQRTPSRRGLVAALQRVLDQTFESHLATQAYVQARQLYELTESKYAASVQALLQQWQRQLESLGLQTLRSMQAAADAGQLRQASLLGSKVLEIWPATPGAAELIASVAVRYPMLRVGVQQTASLQPVEPDRWNWAARRTERLMMRHLFEVRDVGPDGCEYAFTLGTFEGGDSTRTLQLQVDVKPPSLVTGVHVAQLLLSLGDSQDPLFDPTWASLCDRIGARDLSIVDVFLRRPHLRPEAMLDVSLSGLRSAELEQAWRPYIRQESSTVQESSYRLNPDYARANANSAQEIVEYLFETPRRAFEALRRGELDMMDRVFPADVSVMQRDASIVVAAYRVPTMHVLVPNYQRKHTANRLFRRGLVYAIDRQKILTRDLLGGRELPGCQVVSGPFAPGVSSDDPISYGNDIRIEARAYDPRHARTLLQLAQIEELAAAEQAQASAPSLTRIVLAHPPHEIARIACREIVEDLKIIGLPCELSELPAGTARPADDQWDLLYLDYVIPEPLVDAARLLSSRGFVGTPNPYIGLALRQLDRVDNWNRAGERLRVIHQLCFDDTTVIPLWQLVEHLAYRKGLKGLPSESVTTYQDIESWRIVPE